MSILDEFVILVKSNAKETEKDMDSLDKKVKQTQENIDKTDKSTKQLGLSFGDLVKAFVSADVITDFFDKIKGFTSGTADYESKLLRLSQLTGQNVSEIDAWDQALQQFGAPAGEFLSFLEQANDQAIQMGQGGKQAFDNLINNIERISHFYKDASIQAREFGFIQAGLPKDFALIPDDKLQATLAFWVKNRSLTQENAEEARKYKIAIQELDATWVKLFNDALPLLKIFVGLLDEFALGVRGAMRFGGDVIHGNWGEIFSGGKRQATPTGGISNQEESKRFWLSQGFSPAQVAALLGNEQAEGGFKSNAVGDNGTSFGLFQWHDPNRIDAILAATGIDVRTASHADQLRAAAWELQNSGYADKLKGSSTPGQGAAILTQYENPANAQAQAILRGQYADQYLSAMNNITAADTSPLNSMPGGGSKTVNVNVGDVTINTQATDAQSVGVHFANELNTHIRNAWGTFDDPIVY